MNIPQAQFPADISQLSFLQGYIQRSIFKKILNLLFGHISKKNKIFQFQIFLPKIVKKKAITYREYMTMWVQDIIIVELVIP